MSQSRVAEGLTGPRLAATALVRDGFRRLSARPAAFAVVWLVYAAAQGALELAPVGEGVSGLTVANLLTQAAAYVGAGVCGAWATRIALDGPRDWWRPDGALLAAAALLAFGQAIFTFDSWLMQSAATLVTSQERALSIALAALFAYPLLVFGLSKLLLWPIGLLAGDREMGPGRSWVLMRGAVRAWWLANLITVLPIVVAGVPLAILDGGAAMRDLPVRLGFSALTAAWAILCHVIAVAIYEARAGGRTRLAEVFG